jgi:hypothetical protein
MNLKSYTAAGLTRVLTARRHDALVMKLSLVASNFRVGTSEVARRTVAAAAAAAAPQLTAFFSVAPAAPAAPIAPRNDRSVVGLPPAAAVAAEDVDERRLDQGAAEDIAAEAETEEEKEGAEEEDDEEEGELSPPFYHNPTVRADEPRSTHRRRSRGSRSSRGSAGAAQDETDVDVNELGEQTHLFVHQQERQPEESEKVALGVDLESTPPVSHPPNHHPPSPVPVSVLKRSPLEWCVDGSRPLSATTMLRALGAGDAEGEEVSRALRRRLERVNPVYDSDAVDPRSGGRGGGSGSGGGRGGRQLSAT